MAVKLDKKPDFGGWATKTNLVCADGLTIGPGAFEHMDGKQVPLVYHHGIEDLNNVLGHAILEHRDSGLYAYCFLNGSNSAKNAGFAIEHNDLTMLSIHANRVRRRGDTVVHGNIREVSLVDASANPSSFIDFVSIQHSDGEVEVFESEVVIGTGELIQHSEDLAIEIADNDDPESVWNSMSEAQKNLAQQMIRHVSESNSESNSEETPSEETPSEETPSEETPSEEAPTDSGESSTAQHSDPNNNNNPKGPEMTETLTHNVFDQAAAIKHGLTGVAKDNKYVLSHSDKVSIFKEALQSRSSSLKDVVEGYKITHGIENIDILFPDAKAVSDVPEWVRRRDEWVDRVINGAKHTPFSRIKSLSADLTLDKARAKGYVKGRLKKEEFFAVAKRTTSPQTIYKKQKLDRDDILDITDFDVVAWLKGEMRIMLDEELARAILIGDGRSNADEDKILEDHIRPIATDHELFQTTIFVDVDGTGPEGIIDSAILNRRFYRGSGSPVFFTKEEHLSRMLNAKDDLGRRIYTNISELASVLRVSEIIPVEVMEDEPDLLGIMVNMKDYTIGTNRGGEVSLFDQFDIDYNQYKYLIEVRASGALTKPKSALVFRKSLEGASFVTPVAPTWNAGANSVTVAETTGVTYLNQSNGAVLAAGEAVELAPDQVMTVVAVAKQGYYLDNSADEWTYEFGEGLIEGPR